MANTDRWCFAWAPKWNASPGTDRAALLDEVKWNPGDVITISFLEGDAQGQEKVIRYAKEWTRAGLADLTLDFRKGTNDTLVRTSFSRPGSWSVLGTTCKRITDKSEPTMNYGWLTPQTSEDEVRRVVLHEFGHALLLPAWLKNPLPSGGI